MQINDSWLALLGMFGGLLMCWIGWLFARPLIDLHWRGEHATAHIVDALKQQCSTTENSNRKRVVYYDCYLPVYGWSHEGVEYRDSASMGERTSDQPILGVTTEIVFIPAPEQARPRLAAEASPAKPAPIQPVLMMVPAFGPWLLSVLLFGVGLTIASVSARSWYWRRPRRV